MPRFRDRKRKKKRHVWRHVWNYCAVGFSHNYGGSIKANNYL